MSLYSCPLVWLQVPEASIMQTTHQYCNSRCKGGRREERGGRKRGDTSCQLSSLNSQFMLRCHINDILDTRTLIYPHVKSHIYLNPRERHVINRVPPHCLVVRLPRVARATITTVSSSLPRRRAQYPMYEKTYGHHLLNYEDASSSVFICRQRCSLVGS